MLELVRREEEKVLLERLSKYDEISILDFINKELLIPNLFSVTEIYGTWNILIKRLINQNKIRIVRKEYQINSLGYKMQVEIIAKNP